MFNTKKVKILQGQFSFMIGELLWLREELSLLRDELNTMKKKRAGDKAESKNIYGVTGFFDWNISPGVGKSDILSEVTEEGKAMLRERLIKEIDEWLYKGK